MIDVFIGSPDLEGFANVYESWQLSNTSFPTLENAYCRRGKVRRKPGSTLLGRLRRDLTNQDLGNTDGSGNFSGNIISILGLESNSAIVPGSVTITVGAQTFTEPATPNGNLSNGAGGSGTILYNTGDITLDTNPDLAATPVSVSFGYYPCLPVMGLEEFEQPNLNSIYVQMDTKYSYQINQSTNIFYDTTFYSTTHTPFTFSGADYQQFYSTTCHQALFCTNGKAGLHFTTITAFPDAGPPGPATNVVNVTLNTSDLVNGDVVVFNEVSGATVDKINGVTATVTDDAAAPVYQFTFPENVTMTTWGSTGIVLYLTASKANNIDGIRYYLGDPVADITKGWVNFAPPLSEYIQGTNNNPQYLIGADLVFVFKDRLLFAGCTIATSASPGGVYNQNMVVYSQNGTPFYANLIPANEGFLPGAWYQNVPARGGFINAPVNQQIISQVSQDDIIVIGLTSSNYRFIFTGDDSFPFIFQSISSDFGSGFTFGAVSLENEYLFVGNYGFATGDQNRIQRTDLKIPDEIFQISYTNNDQKRLCAIRDYRNEWVYFTYPTKQDTPPSTFPDTTLMYNYREGNWARFQENYTHYGKFQRTETYTWATLPFRTWAEWTVPWNFGGTDERFPNVIGGNQQGFVLLKANRDTEDYSNYITAIVGNLVTSPNHGMQDGDYIYIVNAIGTNTEEINGVIQQVHNPTANDFQIDTTYTGTYKGNAIFKRIPKFDIRTKTFAPFWAQGRKTRNSPIRILADNAGQYGQITINLYASSVEDYASNTPDNSAFTDVLLTSPEPNNLLQTDQTVIWHRLNQVIVGDSIQIGFTLSDTQMRDLKTAEAEFNLNAIYMQLYPAGVL